MAAGNGAGDPALDSVDVAVVGGGPGGLATAAAILSALGKNTRVKVRLSHPSCRVRRMLVLSASAVSSTSLDWIRTYARTAPSCSMGLNTKCINGGHRSAVLLRIELRRRWLALQVYESSATYTLQGSAVGLSANAQHALEAIHPDLFKRCATAACPMMT